MKGGGGMSHFETYENLFPKIISVHFRRCYAPSNCIPIFTDFKIGASSRQMLTSNKCYNTMRPIKYILALFGLCFMVTGQQMDDGFDYIEFSSDCSQE